MLFGGVTDGATDRDFEVDEKGKEDKDAVEDDTCAGNETECNEGRDDDGAGSHSDEYGLELLLLVALSR